MSKQNRVKSSELVSIPDVLFVDVLPILIVYHGIHEPIHLIWVIVVQGFISGNLCELADSVDIFRRVVLVGWSPCSDDLGDSSAVVVANVATQ